VGTSTHADRELAQASGKLSEDDARRLLAMMHAEEVPVRGATLQIEAATTRELVSLKLQLDDGSKMFRLTGAATLTRTADLSQLREAVSASMTAIELKCHAQGLVPENSDAELLEGAGPHTVLREVLRLLRMGIEADRDAKRGMWAGTAEDIGGQMQHG